MKHFINILSISPSPVKKKKKAICLRVGFEPMTFRGARLDVHTCVRMRAQL